MPCIGNTGAACATECPQVNLGEQKIEECGALLNFPILGDLRNEFRLLKQRQILLVKIVKSCTPVRSSSDNEAVYDVKVYKAHSHRTSSFLHPPTSFSWVLNKVDISVDENTETVNLRLGQARLLGRLL